MPGSWTSFGLPAGARILDVACGFGRIAGGLQERGYAVTRVDINPGQIARARQEHPGPRYLVADIGDPPAGPYDAVVNIFASFGYFADDVEDLRALQAWSEVLAPGGQLQMTLTHCERVVAQEAISALEDDDRPLHEEARTDWVRGLRHITWRYEATEKRATLRLYTATELVALCEQDGFARITATGGLDGRPLSPGTGLCLHARKASAQ